MILRAIVCAYFFHLVNCQSEKSCLTGYMTDVQSWVDRNGKLTSIVDVEHTIDLSTTSNAVPMLEQQLLTHFKYTNGSKRFTVKFLSIANCRLSRVPVIFDMKDSNGRFLADTVEYLTLYGNEFADISLPVDKHDANINATKAMELVGRRGFGRQSNKPWSAGFRDVTFHKLKELDLRRCSIQILNGKEFIRMPELEALYLGENEIFYMSTYAFAGLNKLVHLDLSRNVYEEAGVQKTLTFQSKNVFRALKQLRSLDLSYTKLSQNNIAAFFSLGKMFQRLSLCKSEILLEENIFNGTSLRILDLSGNPSILSTKNVLGGLENTLEVLYSDGVGLINFDVFANFTKMQILKLSRNNINFIFEQTASSLQNVQILDLDNNKMQTWFSQSFSKMSNLRFLSLRQNNINLLSQNMMNDLQNISYLGLSGNMMVCNCHSRELYNIALKNQRRLQPLNLKNINRKYSFHTAYDDYVDLIRFRTILEIDCDKINGNCAQKTSVDGNYILFDYDDESYHCLHEREGQAMEIYKIKSCSQMQRYLKYEEVIHQGWNKIVILICTGAIILPVLIFVFVYRRNLRYCCITMRNSAMLSLIKNDGLNDSTIFNYDVFVSYCNEDRSWVLDHLLPHVERDCNISVCLHERDFQVGLSILENIVSCMDRSRSIMLIISQRFLLSQWCQFEMHLAQHRLLETRREDLILILLEDIPRRMRPNTLHYLMVTKTYIVWPKDEADRPQFWRRLTRSAVTPTLRQRENVSQA